MKLQAKETANSNYRNEINYISIRKKRLYHGDVRNKN